MRNFVKILIALIVVFSAVGIAYHHYVYVPEIEKDLTTVSVPENAEKKNRNKDILLAGIESENIFIYYTGKSVILDYKGTREEFSDWSNKISFENPEMLYTDMNGDGKNDIVVKAYCGKDEFTGKGVYELYIIQINEETSPATFELTYADRALWTSIFSQSIRCEFSQLVSTPKRLQFAMTTQTEKSISYDVETGIAKDCYTAYALAPMKNAQYCKLSRWEFGNGYYYVGENSKICLDIEAIAYYEGINEPQIPGSIHCEFKMEGKKFKIVKGSVTFNASEGNRVTSPNTEAVQPWSCEIKNFAPASFSQDKVITWLSGSFALQDSSQRIDFSSFGGEMKYVKSVLISQDKIVLTVGEKFTFGKGPANSSEYTVVINENLESSYSIENGCEINNKSKDRTLTIYFDKEYNITEIKTLSVKYGV